jgi:hypothetical protein
MSVSDFVNHKVGGITSQHYKGAIQASIDKMLKQHKEQKNADGENAPLVFWKNVYMKAGGLGAWNDAGTTPDYSANFAANANQAYFANDIEPMHVRRSTTGIPGDITQANILRALAPRLTARSDTFRIRGYGEVTDADGNIIAKATCEAIVQRLPEYVDSDNNEPWDEGATLNATNQKYGRRFEIRRFRWLDESEI